MIRSYFALIKKAGYPLTGLVTSETIVWFGITAVLTRTLTPKEWGEYNVLISIAMILASITFMSPTEDSLFARFLATRRAQGSITRDVYSSMAWIWITAILVAFIILLLTAPALCAVYRVPHLVHLVPVAALGVFVFMPITNHLLAAIQGFQRIKRWGIVRALSTLSVFIVLFIAATTGAAHSLATALAVVAGGWLIAVVIALFGIRGVVDRVLPSRPNRAVLMELLRPILVLLPGPLACFIATAILPCILTRMSGVVSVGHFAVARTVLMYLSLLHVSIMVPLLPEWSQLYEQRDGQRLLKSFRDVRNIELVLAFAYCAVFIIGGEHLIGFLFGPAMKAATLAVWAILGAGPLLLMGWLCGSCMVLTKRTDVISMANIVWSSIIVGAALILTPRFGAAGATFGWTIAYFSFFLVYLIGMRPFFRELKSWSKEQEEIADVSLLEQGFVPSGD